MHPCYQDHRISGFLSNGNTYIMIQWGGGSDKTRLPSMLGHAGYIVGKVRYHDGPALHKLAG